MNFVEPVIYKRICPFCGEYHAVEVEAMDLFLYRHHGVLAQNAFPYLSANEREIIISGICPACWDNMFRGDNEEEEEDDAAECEPFCEI